jgi:hypothetical protein
MAIYNKDGISVKEELAVASDFEQRILIDLDKIMSIDNPQKVYNALRTILSQLIATLQYLEEIKTNTNTRENTAKEFQSKINEVGEPRVKFTDMSSALIQGWYIENEDRKLKIPTSTDASDVSRNINIFQKYEYQQMNNTLYLVLSDVLKELMKYGYFTPDKKLELGPYARTLLGIEEEGSLGSNISSDNSEGL